MKYVREIVAVRSGKKKSQPRDVMKATIFCAHYRPLKMSSGSCYVLYLSHSIYCQESVIKSCISWHVVSRILSFMSCFTYVALSFMNSLCFSWPLCVIEMILSFVHLLEPAVYLSAHINGPVLPKWVLVSLFIPLLTQFYPQQWWGRLTSSSDSITNVFLLPWPSATYDVH